MTTTAERRQARLDALRNLLCIADDDDCRRRHLRTCDGDPLAQLWWRAHLGFATTAATTNEHDQ
jgi:hypothetical protein